MLTTPTCGVADVVGRRARSITNITAARWAGVYSRRARATTPGVMLLKSLGTGTAWFRSSGEGGGWLGEAVGKRGDWDPLAEGADGLSWGGGGPADGGVDRLRELVAADDESLRGSLRRTSPWAPINGVGQRTPPPQLRQAGPRGTNHPGSPRPNRAVGLDGKSEGQLRR